jgi:c-di-GMP-binding flagellar brake protein YcgR
MQRRDCYRLLSSARRPPQCEIPISPRQRVTVDLHDISCTGVSVLGCPPNLSLDTSREYHGCRIELGDLGSVVVSLRFVNGFDITTRSGHRLRRAGCRFTCMSEGAEKTIQRYILREQRERQARRRGLR